VVDSPSLDASPHCRLLPSSCTALRPLAHWRMSRLEDERAAELEELPNCTSSVSCSVPPLPCQNELRSAVGDKEGAAVDGQPQDAAKGTARRTDGQRCNRKRSRKEKVQPQAQAGWRLLDRRSSLSVDWARAGRADSSCSASCSLTLWLLSRSRLPSDQLSH
jgi:hypothetical protein